MAELYRPFLCAALRQDSERARFLLQDRGWQWEKLFGFANEQYILPAFSVCLQTLDLDIPPDIRNFLSAVITLNKQRNRAALEQLRDIARALNEVGIEPVLLKGAAYLASGIYRDPGGRYLLDLDLLIPERQLQKAVEVLRKLGYLEDSHDIFGYFRHHYPPLCRPGSFPIELHHRLGLGSCGSLLSAEEVIERAAALDLDGVPVRVPCSEHLITHLVLHSQMVHPYHERIWPPLRALYDLVQLQKRITHEREWDLVADRFCRAGKSDLLRLHLLDVHDELGLPFPPSARSTSLTHLRRMRRAVIRRWPRLRYLDPIYMFSELFTRRLRVFQSILSTRSGARTRWRELLSFGVYRRLLSDALDGRGR